MGEMLDKAKGKAKQATGAITGNESLVREGKRDEARGKLKGAAKDLKRAGKDVAKDVKRAAKDAAKSAKEATK